MSGSSSTSSNPIPHASGCGRHSVFVALQFFALPTGWLLRQSALLQDARPYPVLTSN
jgi:hypothetical protein